MEVIRSKNAGACYGVQRALDLALKASEGDGSAFTLGPLIHNPQVVANLEARGVMAVSEPEQATHGAIIIRSHGVTPAVRRSVEARGLPVIDATCPHVARAQKAAATLAEECGYVVVVGEEGHPEVEGLVAYAHEAGAQVHVAETAADLPGDLPEHVGVVVQTTQTRDALDDVLEGIRAQGVAAQVKDTVCTATRRLKSRVSSSSSRLASRDWVRVRYWLLLWGRVLWVYSQCSTASVRSRTAPRAAVCMALYKSSQSIISSWGVVQIILCR